MKTEHTKYVIPFPDLTSKHLQPVQYMPTDNPRGPWGGVAAYLAKRYKDRIYMVVFDEVHEYKGVDTSAQARAMTRLANAAKRIIGMTGTLYGGVASSLYYLEFMVNPRVRENYPMSIDGQPTRNGINSWVEKMGVLEEITTVKERKKGKATDGYSSSTTVREAPGASPELLAEVIDHTLFIGMHDIVENMPPLVHQGMGVWMDSRMRYIYSQSEAILKAYLDECRQKGDGSFLGAYFHALLDWPNNPYEDRPVIHRKTVQDPVTGEEEVVEKLVCTIPGMGADYVTMKEQELVKRVKQQRLQNRGVAVFLQQTGPKSGGLQYRLKDVLEKNIPNIKVKVLTSSVSTSRREAWLEKNKDIDVLICNAKLVATGLDLLNWPHISFYELPYSLYVVDQASRRAWRIIQTKDCTVDYMYYFQDYAFDSERADGTRGYKKDAEGNTVPLLDTMEGRGVSIVSAKREAAAFLYGEEGASLSAMVDGGARNMVTALAKELDNQSVTDGTTLFRQAAGMSTDKPVVQSDWMPEENPNSPYVDMAKLIVETEPDVFVKPKPEDDNANDLIPLWMEVPALYSQEYLKPAEQTVHVRLFTPDSSFTWYITEYRREEKLASGYTWNGRELKAGYVSIEELEGVPGPMGLAPERDFWFDACTVEAALRKDRIDMPSWFDESGEEEATVGIYLEEPEEVQTVVEEAVAVMEEPVRQGRKSVIRKSGKAKSANQPLQLSLF